MSTSVDATIAAAILHHLAIQIGTGPTARAFVRLEGFSAATYHVLLNLLAAQQGQLAGRTLIARSIVSIEGHPNAAMESDRSATWYRNHLPAGQTLLLILNRRTSDSQSLQDIYAVSEQLLTRNGLGELIKASIVDYQLDASQQRLLVDFVRRLRRLRLDPQLRDLTEFLCAIDEAMQERPGKSLPEAITDALPTLNLFRCRELAAHLNTPRGDKLLRTLKDAAHIGTEVLDDRIRQEHLSRLKNASFADDRAFGGFSADEKAELLRRFIDGTVGDNRMELVKVLNIDWNEVRDVISSRGRATKTERYLKVADRLQTAVDQIDLNNVDDVAEIVEALRDGREPEGEVVERLLNENGESLGKALRNDLRRMVRPRTRRSADFLVGLAAVAIDLLHPRQNDLTLGTQLRVALATTELERRNRLHEAASNFQAIYGGIEQALPTVQWQIGPLWMLAQAANEPQDEEEEERERIVREELSFRVTLIGLDGSEIAMAELIWQYRSDSPTAATMQALATEQMLLKSNDFGPLFTNHTTKLRVPIYNGCQPLDEIGDLDLRHPLSSLGAWYEQADDLRIILENQLKPMTRPQIWASLEAALIILEQAWGEFVEATSSGLLSVDISRLLHAYESLLSIALGSLTTGNEVSASYRLLNQAWVISPPSITSWAIVPLLHPLKLLWLRERTRYINHLIAQLLDPTTQASIVDVKRFQQELAATYGSSGFPPVLALPPSGRPAVRFLPIEEAEGYELYFYEASSAEAFGLDTDLLAEDENEIAALRAVEGIVAVVQDYIETYPFVRDGVEVFLFECRNGALPGLLIEQLTRAGERRGWSIRLTVVVHTSKRGAPLFRRVSKWVASGHSGVERQGQAYFPPITVKVLECEPNELFDQQEDTDIVILADVLAERGQQVRSELLPLEVDDPPCEGYLPTYRARQEPFQKGEPYRRILLSAPQQPTIARLFMLAQHAAVDRRAPRIENEARFYRDLTLEEWRSEIERLHERFNWVICYDPTIDRFLLQAAFPNEVQVIRYSLGLGAKRQHNLTVSSSGRAQEIVTRRLATRLSQMFPRAPDNFCRELANQLVHEAKEVSGDIVLRAAGPGAFLNELIGLVAAKFETERRYKAQHPNALITWILLDDFEHWFGSGKFPDLLFIAIGRSSTGDLALHLQILEAKCVGELSFDSEANDAQEQVRCGVGRILPAFAPAHEHLDALYWYDQFYRAIAGNLSVEPEQLDIWELFRDHLHTGNFLLDISGHSWIFCYDGQAGVSIGPTEYLFDIKENDMSEVTLRTHHYGRNELAGLMSALINARGGMETPPEGWAQMPVAAIPTDLVLIGTWNKSVVREDEGPIVSTTTHTVPEPSYKAEPDTISTALIHLPAANVETPALAASLQWLADKSRDLERALRLRGIQLLPIDPAQADVGPSIVRFKLRLRPNESLRKIQGVAEDLARDLALSSTPIIDNVLRTNFVGVDIPREKAQLIDLRPLLGALSLPGPAELPIVIGVTPDGSLVVEDLSEFPHLLVAGATNSGKSVFLRSLLLSLMTQYPAGKLEFLIVDPKRTDFTFFNNVPYLRGGKVITERNEARDALLELVRGEMPRRQNLIANRSMKIKLFNQRYPDEALPPIVALIDEYALLVSMMDKKEREAFEQDLMILGAAARSVGIHLVLATQRPSADIVTSTLKANLDARIAFRVASNTNSRVVLDATGAENLLGRGDMLFRRPSGEITRLQAPFMDEEQMQAYLVLLGEVHPPR